MGYFVYFNVGQCVGGSHAVGLERFATRAEAIARYEELLPKLLIGGGRVEIVQGELVIVGQGS